MSFPKIKEEAFEARPCSLEATEALRRHVNTCRPPHLPPVLKKVLPKDVLCGVLMIQHLGKKCSYLLSGSTKFHWLT